MPDERRKVECYLIEEQIRRNSSRCQLAHIDKGLSINDVRQVRGCNFCDAIYKDLF